MILAFFTIYFSRCAQSSSSFAKTFLYVRQACKYTDIGNYVVMYRKKLYLYQLRFFNGFKHR